MFMDKIKKLAKDILYFKNLLCLETYKPINLESVVSVLKDFEISDEEDLENWVVKILDGYEMAYLDFEMKVSKIRFYFNEFNNCEYLVYVRRDGKIIDVMKSSEDKYDIQDILNIYGLQLLLSRGGLRDIVTVELFDLTKNIYKKYIV